MEERKVTVNYPSESDKADAFEVDITQSIERMTDVELADGTILKTKLSVLSAARVDNQHDNEGNPIYVLKTNQILIVSHAPAHLKEKK